jgi:DNA-binding response OmpR family regulator
MTPTGVLLLVENHSLIQNTLRDALTDAGYEVTVASDSKKALMHLNASPDRFGGPIIDIGPGAGPDGWGVLYRTGQSGDDWQCNGVPKSGMAPKPFAAGAAL